MGNTTVGHRNMNRREPRITIGRIARATAVGAGVGIIANLIVYAIARAIGFDFSVPSPQNGEPMPLPPIAVITATLIPAIGAGVVWFILNRTVRYPQRSFLLIAGVVLLISFAGPFTLSISLIEQLILNLMHVIAAAAIVWALIAQSSAS